MYLTAHLKEVESLVVVVGEGIAAHEVAVFVSPEICVTTISNSPDIALVSGEVDSVFGVVNQKSDVFFGRGEGVVELVEAKVDFADGIPILSHGFEGGGLA